MKRLGAWLAGCLFMGVGACGVEPGESDVPAVLPPREPSVVHLGGGADYAVEAPALIAVLAPEPAPVGAAPTSLASRRDRALERDLQGLVDKWFVRANQISKGKLLGSETQISVSVRDAKTGAVVVDLRAGRSMRPASNLKLVTSAAALVLSGPGGQFETRYEIAGSISDGVLQGDLIVRAGGDPVVQDGSGGQVETYFTPLLVALGQAGVERIAGAVVLDEGDFLDPGIGPAWPSANQHWTDYCALSGGFSLNGGVLDAVVTATGNGKAARVDLHPVPTGLDQRIGVKTKAGSINDVRVGATASQVTVRGTIGSKVKRVEASFRHPDPVALFGAVLEERLGSVGISIDGGLIRRRGPPPATPLLAIQSPIADSLVPINTHSNNSVADQLFFKLGHDFGGAGTRSGGEAAIGQALGELGVSVEGLHQVDGSGLSRDNRIAPEQLTALVWSALEGLEEGAWAAKLYRDSLAVMGQTGTLEKRMRGTASAGRVFAKTGFIDGTSTLSGLALAEDGRRYVFSVFINYPSIGGLNQAAWKPMQEAMVARLVEGEQL